VTVEQLTIALAIAALLLSLLAIASEIAFFIINSRVSKEMHGLLGELRGRASGTQEQLERHFASLLNAVIDKGADKVSEETQAPIQELREHLEALEKKLPSAAREAVKGEMSTLEQRVNTLAQELAQKTRSALTKYSAEAMGEFPPVPPHRFYGKVTIDGKPAPDDTLVVASPAGAQMPLLAERRVAVARVGEGCTS